MKYKLIKNLRRPKEWFAAQLYELSDPVDIVVCGFATCFRFVVVAFSPRASDHGEPETQGFAANKDGSFFGGFADRDSPHAEDHTFVQKLDYESAALEKSRVVGGVFQPRQCLENLLK